MTLDDLIQKGVEMHNADLEAARKRWQEEQAQVARERAEAERAILALFPPVLHQYMVVEFPPLIVSAHVHISLPKGKVDIYLEREGNEWAVKAKSDYHYRRGNSVYEAHSPEGYYREFLSLEKAVAYAMGAIS